MVLSIRPHLTKGFGGPPLDIEVLISECPDEGPDILLLFHLFDIRGFRAEYIQYFQLHHHLFQLSKKPADIPNAPIRLECSIIAGDVPLPGYKKTVFIISQVRDFVAKVPGVNGK